MQQFMAELGHRKDVDQVEEQLFVGHPRMMTIAMPQEWTTGVGFARLRQGLVFHGCERRQIAKAASAAGTMKTINRIGSSSRMV